ncbi:MAG: hypothetical protein E7Z84_07110 [Methanosphaera stadtmanae]|nr:hypothetical protein [Methanosphaera stadtmanae]
MDEKNNFTNRTSDTIQDNSNLSENSMRNYNQQSNQNQDYRNTNTKPPLKKADNANAVLFLLIVITAIAVGLIGEPSTYFRTYDLGLNVISFLIFIVLECILFVLIKIYYELKKLNNN